MAGGSRCRAVDSRAVDLGIAIGYRPGMELVAKTEPGRRFSAVAEAHAEAFRERAPGHDAAGTFPAENFEELKKSGGIAAFVPQELGGFGLDSVHDWAVAMERFGRADASTAIALNMHLAITRMLAQMWRGARAQGDDAGAARNEGMLRAVAAGVPNVRVLDHHGDLPSLMAASELVVAMGGYNTSAEILAVGARAVIVPRSWRSGEHGDKGKTGVDGEQAVRAEGLANTGLVATLDATELSSETLAAAMDRALSRPSPESRPELRLDGADRVAELLLELARS